MDLMNPVFGPLADSTKSVDSLDAKPSKAEILRGIIVDKLSTAAQEIFAVVERTVAGYEEEASGLKKEVDRQRKQLEVILQPQVTLCRIDEHGPLPLCVEEEEEEEEEEEGAAGGVLSQDVEQQQRQTDVEDDAQSQEVSDDADEDEAADEEEPAQSSSPDQEVSKDPEYQIPNTSNQPVKIRVWSPISLRVCLLKDSETSKIKKGVLKTPMQEMKCPKGMQEAHFLDYLRSIFPQLTGQIEAFTTDSTRKLMPLKVEKLTPAEIYRSIKSTGKGRSALYIRAKRTGAKELHPLQRKHTCTGSDPAERAESEKTDSVISNSKTQQVETEDDDDDGEGLPFLPDPTTSTGGAFAPDKDRNRRVNDCEGRLTNENAKRPAVRQSFNSSATGRDGAACDGENERDDTWKVGRILRRSLLLRVCLLRDTKLSVFRTPIRKVKFPNGMQEADFVKRLRSIFPQLTGQFDAFTTDSTKKLTPLKVKKLTPEEIYRSIKSTGKGRSALYIRAKQTPEKDLNPLQRKHLSTSAATHKETRKHSSSDEKVPHEKTGAESSSSRRQPIDTEDSDDGEGLPSLPDPTSEPAGPSLPPCAADREENQSEDTEKKRRRPVKRYTVRSSPDSDDSLSEDEGGNEWRPGREMWNSLQLRVGLLNDTQTDVLTNQACQYPVRNVRCPCGLEEESFLDLLRSTFPNLRGGNRTFDAFLTDRLKKLIPLKVKALTPEEIHRAIRSTGRGRSALYIRLKAANQSPNVTASQRNDEATAQLRSTPTTSCDRPVLNASSHSGSMEKLKQQQQQQEVEREDGEEVESEEDVEWKPDKNDEEPGESEPESDSAKSRRKRRVKPPSARTKRVKRIKLSFRRLSKETPCKVCGSLFRSICILIKHSWSHVEDPERLCGFCGEHSESVEELRSHLQSHQKAHICNICGKIFLSVTSLKNHTKLHTALKSYKCDICDKAFTRKSGLSNHKWYHVEDRPYKCKICPQSFGLKQQLIFHTISHTGEKPYSCNLCNKSFSHFRSFSAHKLMHRGEKRFACQVCGMRFNVAKKAKDHEKFHTVREKTFLCHICCKTFSTRALLNVHLKTHGGEKSLCNVCGKELSSTGGLKRHMIIHSGERPYSCSECGQAFNALSTLRSHMRMHSGEKRFICGICGKACARRYHLMIHMRTHNGERPHKCTLCDKAFTQSHCLKKHMSSH